MVLRPRVRLGPVRGVFAGPSDFGLGRSGAIFAAVAVMAALDAAIHAARRRHGHRYALTVGLFIRGQLRASWPGSTRPSTRTPLSPSNGLNLKDYAQ